MSVPAASISPTCWPARGSTTACRRRPSAPGWSAPVPSAPWGMESASARWGGGPAPVLPFPSVPPGCVRGPGRGPELRHRWWGCGGEGGSEGGSPIVSCLHSSPPVSHHLVSPLPSSPIICHYRLPSSHLLSPIISHHHLPSPLIISRLPSSPISRCHSQDLCPGCPREASQPSPRGSGLGLPGSGCSQRGNPAPKPCPSIWGGESIAAGLPSRGLEAPGRRSCAEGAELCTNNVFSTLSSTKG